MHIPYEERNEYERRKEGLGEGVKNNQREGRGKEGRGV